MSWLAELARTQPVAHAVLALAIVAVLGLALGGLQLRGVRLGSAGVLFAGIVLGHFGLTISEPILAFLKEFGLILFVFTIGLQLGPGFFAALRREGIRLNALAAAVVAFGTGLTLLAAWLFELGPFAAVGLFSGATTNTPSLGAAQQVLTLLEGVSRQEAALPALAYAVAYPAAIAGIIASLLLMRKLFRIDLDQEAVRFRTEQLRGVEPLERMHLVVQNPNLDGLPLDQVPGRQETGVIVSRIRKHGETEVRAATGGTVLGLGDVMLVVGSRQGLEQFRRVVGGVSDANLLEAAGTVISRRVVVTRPAMLGHTLRELGLRHLYGVTVTRVTRAEMEMTAVPHLRLQFGDVLQIVGDDASIGRAAEALGNRLRMLNETQFIPLFLGIALGVLAGLQSMQVPGLPVPVHLGLAGGPLVVAILLSRLGHVGRLVWYVPGIANMAFRELGITLFLACVGLQAGKHFFATVWSPTGLTWLGAGILITVIPVLTVGIVGRLVFKLNFLTLSGLLAGSMTDPPALVFAGSHGHSDAPTLAYASVYPLTMLLRILVAQVLVLVLLA
jgi:putative transport protein